MEIKIVNCNKIYKDKIVLDIEKLNIESGKVYAFMGNNGSGKTTLLHCIAGLEKITDGYILYEGKSVSRDLREKISLMLQKPYLFKGSVKQNIILGLKIRSVSEEVINKKLESSLRVLPIYDLLDKNVQELSGGEIAKVALLRTAIIGSPLVLLDEPTANMDVESTIQEEKIIKKMRQNKKTVIIVTHDYLQAERIADYVVFLDRGKIIEMGPKEIVFNNIRERVLKNPF